LSARARFPTTSGVVGEVTGPLKLAAVVEIYPTVLVVQEMVVVSFAVVAGVEVAVWKVAVVEYLD